MPNPKSLPYPGDEIVLLLWTVAYRTAFRVLKAGRELVAQDLAQALIEKIFIAPCAGARQAEPCPQARPGESVEKSCYDRIEELSAEGMISTAHPEWEATHRELKRMLSRFALYAALSHLREEKRAQTKHAAKLQQQLSTNQSTPSAHEIVEREELNQKVQKCIERLPSDDQLLILMKYFLGLDYKEIGDLTGLSKTTLNNRFHRARAALEKLLRDEGINPDQWSI